MYVPSPGRSDGLLQPPVGLTIRELRVDRMVVLELAGELDLASAGAVRRALERAEADGPGLIVIDLRQLDFIDSAGIHVLVVAHQRIHHRGAARLELWPGGRAVQRVFALTGLDQVLPFANR